MKVEPFLVNGFAGNYMMKVPAKGEFVEFNGDVSHGDWKTASVFPDRWPIIKKGTKVRVIGCMQNLFGVHVSVEHAGSIYDVEISKVKGLK